MEIGSAIVWIIVGYFAIVVGNTAWVWWRGPTGDVPGTAHEAAEPRDSGSAR